MWRICHAKSFYELPRPQLGTSGQSRGGWARTRIGGRRAVAYHKHRRSKKFFASVLADLNNVRQASGFRSGVAKPGGIQSSSRDSLEAFKAAGGEVVYKGQILS